ncbi:MAG: adenylyl-sulfate reductase subunit beta [Chloroflexi bacterium]|nr:adenylyl-sulfate reductase subunit beta [Chloroflexota bacterium]
MPTFVNPEKCDGCKALDRPACHYICPNDLMTLDVALGRAYNREPDLCWECYSCVKTCPQGAIAMRGYGDVVPLGASLQPLRGTDSIMWTLRYRNGQMKRFKFPIRTTAWGSTDPFGGMSQPDAADLKSASLCGDERYLGVPALPTLAKA